MFKLPWQSDAVFVHFEENLLSDLCKLEVRYRFGGKSEGISVSKALIHDVVYIRDSAVSTNITGVYLHYV